MKHEAPKLVFIVDDDPVFTAALSTFLSNQIPNVDIRTFPTGEACMHEMHLNPLVIILDYILNSEFPYAWNGMQVLKKIEHSYPSTNIVIISAQENVEVALDFIRQGAFEYVMKNAKALPTIKDILMDVIDDESTY